MPTYYLETFGCSLNRSDSEYMAARLEEAGFACCGSPDQADVVILNTCTVKDRTFLNFKKRLSDYEKLRKQGGGTPAIVIAGCIPAAQPGLPLLSPYSLLGPDALADVVEISRAALDGAAVRRLHSPSDMPRLNQPVRQANPVIAIVPIAAGCLGECAYCQTRLARGRLRSYPAPDVARHVRSALIQGAREIWLTAQDAGAWGMDIGSRLPDLVRMLLDLSGDFRVRLGMANPDHLGLFMSDLIPLFEDGRLFRFLHMPLQSGSDRVLSAMSRRYQAGDFLRLCGGLRDYDPDFTIATDVIAGFPCEEEKDFLATLDVIEQANPAVVNRSKFSPRPGTPASRLRGLPQSVISERSRRLAALVERLSAEHNRRRVGREEDILVDTQKRPDSRIGRDRWYKSVILPQKAFSRKDWEGIVPGTFARVRITGFETWHLVCGPVAE